MAQFQGFAGGKYSQQINKILEQMTLEEKVGQLIQPSKSFLKDEDIKRLHIGTILSGGGEGPDNQGVRSVHKKNNTPQDWYNMVKGYLEQYKNQRLQIPIIFGVDAVHGHNNVTGTTIFPHNISLGCSNDTELLEKIGRVTSKEMKATGIAWNFAPFVSIPEDFRWGRSYEGLSENIEQTSRLGIAYVKGAQSIEDPSDKAKNAPIACATTKHFLGDGLWIWGTGLSPEPALATGNNFKIDEGDFEMSFEDLYNSHAQPHKAVIDNGVLTVMIAYGRFNKESVAVSDQIINELLRKRLGFKGVVISDWEAVNRARPELTIKEAVRRSFLAGMDAYMIGPTYLEYYKSLVELVTEGVITKQRLDESVYRMLELKFILNLFENPVPKPDDLGCIFSPEHQQLAIESVEKSAVLLKNENNALPLEINKESLVLTGKHADSIGFLCGGWTVTWMGGTDSPVPGVSIKQGLEKILKEEHKISLDYYKRASQIEAKKFDTAVVVVGEECYVEGLGDNPRPSLEEDDIKEVEMARKLAKKVVTIVVSGRPIDLDYERVVNNSDAIVAPFLPGNLGGVGLSNLLLGKAVFKGKLGFTWPKTFENYQGQKVLKEDNILYKYGHGISC